LFVERAASVLGDFKVRDIDVPIVVDICRKLDWIPLAIELAAASIDALGLQGVSSRLDQPLRLPTIRRRSAAPWHHTLRSSLDGSYRLLTEEEQWALRRLSVFAGSFTMDAAAAVATDRNYTKSETVDRVLALVAKSLVAVDADGSGTCLRLLATTRAYTLEKVAESGELDVIARLQAEAPQHSPRAAA
jgi:predicted ATPase